MMTIKLGKVEITAEAGRRDAVGGSPLVWAALEGEGFRRAVVSDEAWEVLAAGGGDDIMAQRYMTWDLLALWGVPVTEVRALVAAMAARAGR